MDKGAVAGVLPGIRLVIVVVSSGELKFIEDFFKVSRYIYNGSSGFLVPLQDEEVLVLSVPV